MKLKIEVVPARTRKGYPEKWVWRVRSDDDRVSSTCIAVGINAPSKDAALLLATRVEEALNPIFQDIQ